MSIKIIIKVVTHIDIIYQNCSCFLIIIYSTQSKNYKSRAFEVVQIYFLYSPSFVAF